MTTKNMIVIMSDEHANKIIGSHGHPFIKTPNMDKLAAEGCRFTSAYTNSPICLPGRAAFATGRYVNETGYWDNAHPYEGAIDSWGHVIQRKGVKSVSIGKLHYRNETDDVGFDEQILPMHVVGQKGDILGSVRDDLPRRMKCKSMSDQIGPGESSYTRYDRNITDLSCKWLEENANDGPFVLYVGLVAPHFPLIAPEAFYNLYKDMDIPMPKAYEISERPDHGWLNQWRKCWIHDEFFDDEKVLVALKSYYGLVSFLDDNIGKILASLEASGVAGETEVIYTSDHGDNMGARGLWGKSTFFEEAAGIPMIVKGPDIEAGTVCETPVTLVDVASTICEEIALETPANWPGFSLNKLAAEPYDEERTVFAEYHAAGAISGAFMLRKGQYKYIHYVGFEPQLFDLNADPEEMNDIAGLPEHAERIAQFETELSAICDPEEVDARAKQDQKKLVDENGGREAIVSKGGFGATPAPGDNAEFRS
ncbi:sulfatase-like hydrolase/transferase [Pontibacterium sp. N1Y112]|uniref:Sulfatase-like hydrolase/transferase n=1 Tax=Pontibacterium sinense TaxID=2781979 RepID=A0A8J7FWN2_9GAMM|nr:sulfatase-like hydrolase/transferase [Pontibacterium sinense]MBE9398955.1 sulfatase-like hydrolase/transferase [Pontibacterium sinense]